MTQTNVVIYKPVITEKSTKLAEGNQIVFSVAPDANKVQIKKALEEMMGDKVVAIRVYWTKPKSRAYGKHIRLKKKPGKRAIVTFKDKTAATVLGSSQK